jgi:Tol biopolymer transport system component
MSHIPRLLRHSLIAIVVVLGFSQMTAPAYAQAGGGGKILFTSNRDYTGGQNMSDIYVMNADGSELVDLTNRSPESELRPAWSPDGQRIVFQREIAGTYHDTEIFVMNADGSGVTRLTYSPGSDELPSWSPDGSQIAFVSLRDNVTGIFVMNANGTNERRLTLNPTYSDSTPAWSPDGTRIAFAAVRDGSTMHQLYVMNSDGTNIKRLTNNGEFDHGPMWSPDGARIAFTSHRDGNFEIYVMDSDGGNQRRLTDNSYDDGTPSWSPDGTKIVFWSSRDGHYGEIYVMNADGSDPVNITNSPAFDMEPRWQPQPAQTAQSTLRFSAQSYEVNEGAGQVLVTVERDGDTSGAAAVEYGSTDGTASDRSDYLTARGVLHFAPGETSKSFTVLVTDDVYNEGDETLVLGLSNQVNAQLATSTPITLKISDNDSATGSSNPIDDAGFFVRQHYMDFLNRTPDDSGLHFWEDQIAHCGNDARCVEDRRIDVSGAYFLSVEFQETGYLVYLMTKASFGTMPRYVKFLADSQAIGEGVVVNQPDWQSRLEANKQAFLNSWVERSEFRTYYAAKTSGQYVDALFANAGLTPGQSERDGLVNGLDTGTETRATVLRKIAENSVLKRNEQNRAFVLMQYFGYLRRNPDDAPDNNLAGYNFWLNKLNEFSGDFRRAEMVKAFIRSGEYRVRFGEH